MTDAAPVICPYRGLASFGESDLDARLFFGRDRETEIVAANVQAARLTVLYGASGVGKSSLLRAGVAHRMRHGAAGEPRQVVVVCGEWGADPVATVETALDEAVVAATGRAVEQGEALSLADRLEALTRLLDGEIYLVLDQLEEYLLYHGADRGGPLAEALAEIVARPSLRVGVLLGIRDDALARLDALKTRIPSLFGNLLRLDHLTREEGREAIVAPLAELVLLGRDEVVAEAALVESVLDEVAAGRIAVAEGRGVVPEQDGDGRIEAPFLQLVMERLWEVEVARGSSILHAATLAELGGASRIVEEHLDLALAALDPPGRDLAAVAFGFLVTPSGTKIAHSEGDLARYAGVGVAELQPVLGHLSNERILRPVADEHGGAARFEIYHDVLADAVLAWSVRHATDRELEHARVDARRRHRRLLAVACAAVAGLLAMTALTAWALVERDNAEQQATAAQAASRRADQEAAAARKAEQAAAAQAAAAEEAQQEAEQQADVADAAKQEADEQAAAAEAAQEEAESQAVVADQERERADAAAADAERARARAEDQAADASAARVAAERESERARAAGAAARRQALVAQSNERVAVAVSLLDTAPESSLGASLEALALQPMAPVEGPLRSGLLASHVRDVLPGGGGPLVAALPGAVAATPPARAAARGVTPGSGVVTVSETGEIRVFDRRRGTLLRSIPHNGRVTACALSSDGLLLAVGGPSGIVSLYAVSSGAPVASVRHVGAVTDLGFSPDRSVLVTAGVNETAKVWSVEGGALLHRLEHPRAVRRLVFDPAGTRLLTISSDTVARVFDLRTGSLLTSLDHGAVLTGAAFQPGGPLIATTGQDPTPRLWDAATGDPVAVLRGHQNNALSVAFSPNGERLVTTSADGTGRVWNTASATVESVLLGHTNFVVSGVFSTDGRHVLTASRDGSARVWNPDTGATQAVLLGHRGRLGGAVFAGDGEDAVTAGEDGAGRTWQLRLEDPVSRPVAATAGAVTAITLSGDGRRWADAHDDGSVNVRTGPGAPSVTVRHRGAVTSVQLSADGRRLLTAGADGTARLWSALTGMQLRVLPHEVSVSAARIAPAGAIMTGDRSGIVRLWPPGGREARVVVRESGPVEDLAVSADGSLFATAVGGVVYLRRMSGGARLRVLVGHRDTVTSVAFGPHGRSVLTASEDHDAILWSTETGQPVRVLAGHVAVVRQAAFSPDGRWVATAGPTRVGLWEAGPSLLRDNRLAFVAGHTRAVSAVALGPRWRLVTGGLDGAVRVYDCALCATTPTLAGMARAKLARLERDASR